MNNATRAAIDFITDGDKTPANCADLCYLNSAADVSHAGGLARLWKSVAAKDGIKLSIKDFRSAWVYIIVTGCFA